MKFATVQSSVDRRYYLCVEVEAGEETSSQWGWWITDGESAWDGGFGLPMKMGENTFSETTRKVEKLELAKEAIAEGFAWPVFSRYKLEYDPDWVHLVKESRRKTAPPLTVEFCRIFGIHYKPRYRNILCEHCGVPSLAQALKQISLSGPSPELIERLKKK